MKTLEAVDYNSADAPELFVQSLRQTGFGVLVNHPLSQQRVQSIYKNWFEFFSTSQCSEYLFDKTKFDGFFPSELAEAAKGHKVRDLKEYFHFYPWGRCPDTLREEITQYYFSTVDFANKLLGWVEEFSPIEIKEHYSEPLPGMIGNVEQSLLRVLHYPPIPSDHQPGAVRAQAHEDINLLTILPASNEPGLQVLTRDSRWLDVPCDFGNLIVNTGDMLQEASNGYFPSTTHRVINPDGVDMRKSRISLPLFLHPRPDVVLSRRHTALSYREERLRELRDTD